MPFLIRMVIPESAALRLRLPPLADALNIFQDANRMIRQSEKHSQYTDILVPIFRALQSYRLRNLVESYTAFERASNAFIQEFRNWDSAWALEALYVILFEIRILAERADIELASFGKTQRSGKVLALSS